MKQYDGMKIQIQNNTRYIITITQPFYSTATDTITSFDNAESLLSNLENMSWVTVGNSGYFQIPAGAYNPGVHGSLFGGGNISTAINSVVQFPTSWHGIQGCDSEKFSFLNILQRSGDGCAYTTPYDMQLVFTDPNNNNKQSNPVQARVIQMESSNFLQEDDAQYFYLPELSDTSPRTAFINPLVMMTVSQSGNVLNIGFLEITISIPSGTAGFTCIYESSNSSERTCKMNLPKLNSLSPCSSPGQPLGQQFCPLENCYNNVGCNT